MIHAELRRVHSPDVADLASWRPDDGDFSILLQLMVGPAGSPGEESFDVLVCSPSHLQGRVQREGLVWVRHTVVVEGWEWPVLHDRLRRQVASASGASWQDVAASLAHWGRWEFEGYQD